MLAWPRLLCTARAGHTVGEPRFARQRTAAPGDAPPRSPFQVDHDRMIYSPAFRRLARKTQVHSRADIDHVHNRLTHSIEVASVGRDLAERLDHFLRRRGELPEAAGVNDLTCISQAACLAHDVGNPPFGHAGEDAVRAWSLRNPHHFDHPGPGVADSRRDFEGFEGNAQTFRLGYHRDNPRHGYHNLTFATLAAAVKYPWDVDDPRAAATGKHSAFTSEADALREVAEHCGLTRPDGSLARHPVSFLTEAADDICYRVLDLEDALEMQIVERAEVLHVLGRLAGPRAARVRHDDPQAAPVLRAFAIGHLIDAFWAAFVDAYPQIMAGQREADLRGDLPADLAEGMRGVAELYRTIFNDRTKIAVEVGAYETLGRILDALCRCVAELARVGSLDRCDFITRRTLELTFERTYTAAHADRGHAWWLHQTLDFVAGLTDNHAHRLAREIAGNF